ncbi:hypothetical protein [Egicoccus halophilus]|uniref:Uncharacterized protein n=1 Tax=Egicoccus halophilus TaxID=1670830 RepID=A0A8J3ESS4_9ACTN|nr:hypothetical protein [Egicoccus halophilus]GGI08054.1 hypothetical protein GCM10011354_27160 [Egicoccus halophilus]
MNLRVPPQLPRQLPDYLPGRIHVLEESRWPAGEWVTNGVRVLVPRYGLEVFTLDPEIDPERVRWHAGRTVHPLEASYVSLLHERRLYVLRGRHVLAAHLAAGSDRIPAQLYRRVPGTQPPPVIDRSSLAVDTGEASPVDAGRRLVADVPSAGRIAPVG